jgi:hypothetical protein
MKVLVEQRARSTDLEDSVYRLVKKAVQFGKNIQVLFHTDDYLCSTDRYLVVLGGSGRFLINNIDFDEVLAAAPDAYRARGLKSSPLISQVEKCGRDIREFYWQAAFQSSGGRLLDGCREDDVIQLRQWPNFTRLYTSPNIYRISSLLSARPTTLDVAARLLSVPKEELYQFYSAALYSGYAEVLNRSVVAEIELKPHPYVRIVKMLLGRFGGGQQAVL